MKARCTLLAIVAALYPCAALAQSPPSPVQRQPAPIPRMVLPPVDAAAVLNEFKSFTFSKQGDAAVKRGDWREARSDYQQSLDLSDNNAGAKFGMGQCLARTGDLADAICDYRAGIYTPVAMLKRRDIQEMSVYQDVPPSRMMEYVLLLDQSGQTAEALAVYNHAVGLIDYLDGSPNLDIMLPEIGNGPGQTAYTPQFLEAMAHTGWAINHGKFDSQGALAHLQQATALLPDSPIPYFYRAQHERLMLGDLKDAKADYEKARDMGDAGVAAAVSKQLKYLP